MEDNHGDNIDEHHNEDSVEDCKSWCDNEANCVSVNYQDHDGHTHCKGFRKGLVSVNFNQLTEDDDLTHSTKCTGNTCIPYC